MPDGMSLLEGLFRPFFQPAKITVHERRLFENEAGSDRRPSPAFARRLFNLIRQQSVEQAVELAQSRYIAVQCPTINLPTSVTLDAERLAAALLVPPPRTDPAGRALVIGTVNGELRRAFGLTLPVRDTTDAPGAYLLAGCAATHPAIGGLVREGLPLRPACELGDEGFQILTHARGDRCFIVISANTPLGLKHGSQELVFFRLRMRSGRVAVDWPIDCVRAPAFPYRGVYMLPCWAPHDSVDAWARAIEFQSELTVNRVWLWLAGFEVIEGFGGEFRGMPLSSAESVERLVDVCRSASMRCSVGGGWFTWQHQTHAGGSMERGAAYYRELLARFPGMTGLYLEPTGEGAGAEAAEWEPQMEALDRLGGDLTGMRPGFEFAVAVGRFNHPAYRARLHRFLDGGAYWWWCWGDPLADGAMAEHDRVLRWHITSPMLEYHGSMAPPKPGERGLAGFATSYDPGQGFGNPWNGWGRLGADAPRNVHPYTMPFFSHQYAFRERCWDPCLSDDDFAGRLQRRLFDDDMPGDAARLYLRLAASCRDPANAAPETLGAAGEFVRAFAGRGTRRNRDTLERMREALTGIGASGGCVPADPGNPGARWC